MRLKVKISLVGLAPGSSLLMLYMLLNYYEIYFSLAIVRSVIISISDELSCRASQWQLVVNNSIKGRKYKRSVMKKYINCKGLLFCFWSLNCYPVSCLSFFLKGKWRNVQKVKVKLKCSGQHTIFWSCIHLIVFLLQYSIWILPLTFCVAIYMELQHLI